MCVCGRVCQRQMGVVGCVYVLEMSRSHLHWSPHSTGEGGRFAHAFVASLFPSSFFFSRLSCKQRIRSLSHVSNTLPICSFASNLCIVTLCLSLSLVVYPFTLNFYFWLFCIILSAFISLSFSQNLFQSLIHSLLLHTVAPSPSILVSFTVCQIAFI